MHVTIYWAVNLFVTKLECNLHYSGKISSNVSVDILINNSNPSIADVPKMVSELRFLK